jgi:hypothetical protein
LSAQSTSLLVPLAVFAPLLAAPDMTLLVSAGILPAVETAFVRLVSVEGFPARETGRTAP